MIAQVHRFHGHNKIDAVYRRSQTLRGNLMNLKYTTANGQKPYRAAVVVSKKVSKSAVVRNRIRRRLYEIIREFDESALAGHELVFIIYSEQVAHLESDRLRATANDLLHRAVNNTNRGDSRAIIDAKPAGKEEER